MQQVKLPLVVTAILFIFNLALFAYAAHIEKNIITVNVDKDNLQKIDSYGYLSDLDINKEYKFYIRGDSRSHPNRSKLTLYIDNVLLPSPHAIYQDVVTRGQGRYRHQKTNTLIFSLPEYVSNINQVQSIIAKIKLYFPRDILKISVFMLIVSMLMLIYKCLNAAGFEVLLGGFCRRILVLFLLICVFFYLWHVFIYMPTLITLTADSIYYFAPSLSLINDGLLDLLNGPTEQGRTFGFVYPGLLAIFTLGGSVNHIPLVQSLLFLCSVCVFFYFVRYSLSVNLSRNVSINIATISSIIMLSYFVYTKYTVEIMPEIVYQLSSILTIFMLSLALTKKLGFNKLVFYCAITIFFVSFNIHVKPHGAAIFLFVWACVIFRILFFLERKRFKLAAIASLVLMAVALFHYPNSFLNQHNSPSKTYGPRTLVCNHVDLIEPVIEKHINDEDAVAFLRSDFHETLNAPNDWEVLGFSGDHCLLRLLTTQKLAKKLHLTLEQQSNLYFKLFISGVLNSPLKYAKKVLSQYAFAITHPYPGRNSIVGKTEGAEYLESWKIRDDFRQSGLHAQYVQVFYDHPLMVQGVDLSWPGRAVLNLLHHFSGVIFLVFIIILVVDIFRVIVNKSSIELVLKAWLLPVFSLVIYLASLSVVAFSHSFDVSRYIQFCSTYAIYFQLSALSVIWYKVSSIGKTQV